MKQIFLQTIQILLFSSLIILFAETQASSQTIQEQQTNDIAKDIQTIRVADECSEKLSTANQRINKLLDDLEFAEKVIASKDAEILKLREVIQLQDERVIELLKLLKEYAALDVKQRKAWWKSAGSRLLEILDTITDPQTVAAIAMILILLRSK